MTYVIIGGGIVGSSVAYHLGERTDDPVVVYERGELASQTTAKSGSFFGFHAGGPRVSYEMKRYGLAMYNRLLRDADGSVRTAHLGRLEIARSTVEDRRLRERERAAKDWLATPTEYVAGPDLDRSLLVPDLRTAAIEGAIYRANMACFQPRPMARLLAERASAAGVRFEDGTAVTDLVTESGSVVGVETDSERIEADHVVCAAGPWVPAFARSVDLDLPARHTLGPMLRVRPAEPIAERLPSLKDHDSGVYLRRDFDGTILVGHRPGGYEVGTVYEVDDVPDRVPEDRREKMLTAATDLVPALADAETVEEWVGVRTLTDDAVPIVDTNAVDGLSLTVMNAEGMQLAPAAGRIIANRLTGGSLAAYDADLRLDRVE